MIGYLVGNKSEYAQSWFVARSNLKHATKGFLNTNKGYNF